MTVIVFLQGGLGNQLFQLWGALEVVRKQETILIESSLCDDRIALRNGASSRRMEIQEIADELEIRSFSLPLRHVAQRYRAFLHRLDNPEGHRRLGPFSLLTGHMIRADHTAVSSLSLWNAIDHSGPPTSTRLSDRQGLHLRLGDYRSLTHVYGAPDWEYYRKGAMLAFAREKEVLVFSDEESLAVECLREHVPGYRYVAASEYAWTMTQPGSWRDLWRMASCRNLVAGNSTYSWWAAWLSLHLRPEDDIAIRVAPASMPVTGLQAPAGAIHVKWGH